VVVGAVVADRQTAGGGLHRQIAQADERFTEEVEPLLADLGLPVHVVWGREDNSIPLDRAERLAAAIPGATVRLLDGAGHLIQYDAPDALHEELAGGWLGSPGSPRAVRTPS
jgi:pimeloyl-ACP methyl ester carboxylesterase